MTAAQEDCRRVEAYLRRYPGGGRVKNIARDVGMKAKAVSCAMRILAVRGVAEQWPLTEVAQNVGLIGHIHMWRLRK